MPTDLKPGLSLDEGLADYYKQMADAAEPTQAPGNRPWTKILWSEALAVHPSRIQEAMELDRSLGVSVPYDEHGRPGYDSRDVRRRHQEAHNYFDRDAGYGDAQRKHGRGCDG